MTAMLRPLALVCLLTAAPSVALAKGKGVEVKGKVIWDAGGVKLNASKMAVYLVPEGAEPALGAQPNITIDQRDLMFKPNMVVVSKGQTVDFPNEDDTIHNVFAASTAKKFDLGTYPKGQSKSVTFDQEGPVTIYCSIHSTMKARVFVAPNALHALTADDGSFAIKNVPAGSYKLRTWHASLPVLQKAVEVGAADAVVTLAPADRMKGER
jgi:plastocyanin